MHRLKYLVIVLVVILSCGFILFRQGNKMWTDVTTEVVSEKVKFISEQNVINTSRSLALLKSTLERVIAGENKVSQLGQLHLGMSESFQSSGFKGVMSLKEIRKKHHLDWVALDNDILKLWSKDFIQKTWRQALAAYQRNHANSLTYIKHTSGESYWGYVSRVSSRRNPAENRVIVSILPIQYFQSAAVTKFADKQITSIIVNDQWKSITHKNKDYISRKMSEHPLAKEVNLSTLSAELVQPYKAEEKNFLGEIKPLKGTNLYSLTYSPLVLNDAFVKNMLASTLMAMVYVLLAAVLLLLLLPEKLNDKYNELLASIKLLAEGSWALSEKQAQLIPEAVETLQSLSTGQAVAAPPTQVASTSEDQAGAKVSAVVESAPTVNEEPVENVESNIETSEVPPLPGGTVMVTMDSVLGSELPEELSADPAPSEVFPPQELKPSSEESFVNMPVDNSNHPLVVQLQQVVEDCKSVYSDVEVSIQLNGLESFRIEESEVDKLKTAIKPVIKNAFEACAEADGSTVSISGDLFGSHYKIKVSDNGPGMDNGVVGKMFDPFFTTKSSSAHPGLGLTAAKNQIQKLNGSMVVSSNEGEGTVVEVIWPVDEATESKNMKAQQEVIAIDLPAESDDNIEIEHDINKLHDAEERVAEQVIPGEFMFSLEDDVDEFSSSAIDALGDSLSTSGVEDGHLNFTRSGVTIDEEEDVPDILMATSFAEQGSGVSLSESSTFKRSISGVDMPEGDEDFQDPRQSISDLDEFKVSIRSPKISE